LFQIIWEPYKVVMDSLPNFCTSGQDIWRTMSPLICFHIGEWHLPDRAIRQFGLKQYIPSECNTELLLHDIDLRTADWSEKIAHLVVRWHYRRRFIAVGVLVGQFDRDATQDYILWYNNITRRYITRPGAALGHLVYNQILSNYFLFKFI